KFTVPAGVTTAQAFPSFNNNLRASYTARNNDYLAELYPALSYDPAKKLDPTDIETSLGLTPDEGSSVTIEGMPVGLDENEVSVQLWRPVTIRGYPFGPGDLIGLDQTKIQKTPPSGGHFAWLYATYQSERSGTAVDTFWNRLPPPLLREG